MKGGQTQEGQSPSVEGLPFAAALTRSAQRQLESLVRVLDVEPNGILAREGDVSRDFMIVADGCFKLWKELADGRRQIIVFRGRGDLLSLHRSHTPWSLTVQAVTASSVYAIEWDALQRFAERYPSVHRTLADITADELASHQERLLTLGRKTIEEKVASFLLEMCQPRGLQSGSAREFHLPMRRPDIADYLGVTTESICREFTRFKRERLVALPRPSYVILLNRPDLEALAAGSTPRLSTPRVPAREAIQNVA